MNSIFQKDSFLRILSVFLALCVWIYIVILLNPVMEVVVRDIPVQYIEQSGLSRDDLSIVEGKPGTITLTISGKRNLVMELDNKNISASVNVGGISQEGIYSLPTQINLPFEGLTVVSKKPYNFDVRIDKVLEKKIPVSVVSKGEVKGGFVVSEILTNPQTISLKGISSLVDMVAEARVNIDFGGKDRGFIQSCNVVLIGFDGSEISGDGIVRDTMSVEVSCTVLMQKTVRVLPNIEGYPELENLSAVPGEIIILGKETDIGAVSEVYTRPLSPGNFADGGVFEAEIILPPGATVKDDLKKVRIVAGHQ